MNLELLLGYLAGVLTASLALFYCVIRPMLIFVAVARYKLHNGAVGKVFSCCGCDSCQMVRRRWYEATLCDGRKL